MKTILIIEDDPLTQKAYSEKLTKEGYQVLPAISHKEVLSYMEQAAVPSGIILDIMLPGGKDGFEVFTEIRKYDAWKHIPVIMLTNLDTERVRAQEMGAAAYLVKSNTSMEQIVETVKTIFGVS